MFEIKLKLIVLANFFVFNIAKQIISLETKLSGTQ